MPGKKKRFTKKDDRQAKHVADSETKRGMSPKDAKSVGFATVNKNKAAKKDAPPAKKETDKEAAVRIDKKQHKRKRNIGRS